MDKLPTFSLVYLRGQSVSSETWRESHKFDRRLKILLKNDIHLITAGGAFHYSDDLTKKAHVLVVFDCEEHSHERLIQDFRLRFQTDANVISWPSLRHVNI